MEDFTKTPKNRVAGSISAEESPVNEIAKAVDEGTVTNCKQSELASPEEPKKAKSGDNPFPLAIFPPKIRSMIETLAEERLYPKDFVASAILFVVSILVGAGSCLVTTLGKTFANIYMAIIGDQGTNKSTPIEWAVTHLLEMDHVAILDFKKKEAEWSEKMMEYRRTYDESKKPGPCPTCERMMCNDVTPEVLLQILADNPMGCGQYHDELYHLFGSLDRYNSGSNEDLFLSLFSGKPVTVDRATKKNIISVPHPYYCMIGTIQPSRYIKMMSKNDRLAGGLFARVLEVNHFDNPALLWNFEDDIPSGVDDEFRSFVRKMYERRKSTDAESPDTYKFDPNTPSAYSIQEWQNEHEKRIEQTGRDIDRAVFRKIQIYSLKFALIIQIMWDVSEGKDNPDHLISFESAVFATLLADYFYHNAKELARSLDNIPLSQIEKNLYKALPNKFDTADGREIAKRYGLGKTCFHNFMNKVKGTLIEQPSRGNYKKIHPEIAAEIFK